ncbi:MAG: Holliday junction resolvase RuvX [Acidimicrobiales bacterium]
MRVVGIDLGERRIGVAVSDGGEVLASPYRTIERGRDPAADCAALVAVIDEVGAGHVVVGLPIGLDGRPGAAARLATEEAGVLAGALAGQGIEVETFDERFTTVSAERVLADMGRKGKARRKVVDQTAATVMLQAWLDGRRLRREHP